MTGIAVKKDKIRKKMKFLPRQATLNNHFFFRYNHFYGVSYAFFSYDGGSAICQVYRDQQIYGLNKKPKKL
jgi:hypothetical protein